MQNRMESVSNQFVIHQIDNEVGGTKTKAFTNIIFENRAKEFTKQ